MVLFCLSNQAFSNPCIIISEFMASNTKTLADEDGDYPDWLEIFNWGDQRESLAGCYLTDSRAKPTKWRFPDISIDAGEYLLIFASSKDRKILGNPLHTNFKLAAEGEYLGLIGPDGTSVIYELIDHYPPQFQDRSYGSTQRLQSEVLIPRGVEAKYFSPLDRNMEQLWKEKDFDDSGWDRGKTGIGYDINNVYKHLIQTDIKDILMGKATSLYLRIPFVLTNPAAIYGLILRMKIDDGYAAYLNGVMIDIFNAPNPPHWNSISLERRVEDGASIYHDVDVTAYRSSLVSGTNVLAIHALNYGDSSSDLLVLPGLDAILPVTGEGILYGYFQVPTPGEKNSLSSSMFGPVIFDESQSKSIISQNESLTITAKIYSVINPVSYVSLCYRTMFEDEVIIPMEKASPIGDITGIPTLYSASIPPGVAAPGELLRYRIVAHDLGEYITQSPYYQETTRAPRYHGTVIHDPALLTHTPVYHWFVEDSVSADDDAVDGTECTLFFNGRLYDNILCRVRGDTIKWSHKESYKFDFNPGYPFFFKETQDPVNEININSTFQDKSYIRPILTLETYIDAGVPSPEAYPLRLQRNDAFLSLAIAVEQIDDQFRNKWKLDVDGALYKMFSGLDDQSFINYEKKDRLNEGPEDLLQLVHGLQPDNPGHISYIFDNIDISQLINYLAVGIICQDWDRTTKNYYFHRENNGSGRWIIIPWDKDLTFGVVGLYNDVITGWSHGYKGVCHPLYGDAIRSGTSENRLFESVYSNPRLRQMFFRRLRTLMDIYLQPPESDVNNRLLENKIDYLYDELSEVANLDIKKWGSGFGKYTDFRTAIDFLKNKYLYERRRFLYQEHLIPEYLKVTGPGKYGNAVSFSPNHLRRMEIPYINEFDSSKLTIEFWLIAGSSTKPEMILSRGTTGPGAWSLYISPVRGSLNFSCPANYPFDIDSLYKVNDNKWHFIRLQLTPTNLKIDLDGRRVVDRLLIGTIRTSTFPLVLGAKNLDGDPDLDPSSLILDDLKLSRDLKVDVAIPHSPLEIDPETIGMYRFDGIENCQFIDESPVANSIVICSGTGEVPGAQPQSTFIEINEVLTSPGTGFQKQNYVMISNPNSFAVDVSGWKFQGLADFTFPPGTVIPTKPNDNSLYIAQDLKGFMNRTTTPRGGEGLYVIGDFTTSSTNIDNSLEIVDNTGIIINSIEGISDLSPQQQFLRITEMMYHPGKLYPGDETDSDDYEYIEVQNRGPLELDLRGVFFVDGISFSFSKGNIQTLAPQEYSLIVRNQSAFQKRYGLDLPIAGEFEGGLNNSGEMIRLVDYRGADIAFYEYKDREGWPCPADGADHSLVSLDSALQSQPIGSLMYYGNWRLSTNRDGSPGKSDPNPIDDIMINEVMISGCSTENLADEEFHKAWIEILNPTSRIINLKGFYLSDDTENPLKWALPENSLIPGAYFSMDINPGLNPKPVLTEGCEQGKAVNLLITSQSADGEFNVKDWLTCTCFEKEHSYGRYPDANPHFITMKSSREIKNFPGESPLVISEIMYKEKGWIGESIVPEYIEIFNQKRDDLEINSTQIAWRLNGSICVNIPEGTVIKGEGVILVVNFDPIDLQLKSAFESIYSCSCEDVIMVGPFSGDLSDTVGRISLEQFRTDCSTGATTNWIPTDDVIYFFLHPWPIIDNHHLQSLQRRSPNISGNDPYNWFLARPTPGYTLDEKSSSTILIR